MKEMTINHIPSDHQVSDTEHEDFEEKQDEKTPAKLNRYQICCMINFSIANFSLGVFYSIIGPFFPQEAVSKGMSTIVTGVTFSIFEFMIIVTSPLFGAYLGQLGDKRTFITGMITTSLSTVAFGFLEYCPPGALFTVMAITIRIVEGCGAAASQISSYAMLARMFPDRLGSFVGTLELFLGLGLMIGPPIGGVLYKFGGFKTPFIVSGTVSFVVALSSIYVLPPQDSTHQKKDGLLWSLLKLPEVLLMVLNLVSGAISIGVLDLALALRLQHVYGFSPVIIGLIFLVGPGIYTLSSPIWGCVADKFPNYCIIVTVVAYLVGGVGFMLMGPAPFLHLPNDMLWLLLVSLTMMGVGLGAIVMSFQVMIMAAVENGMPDSMDTYGVISGILSASISLGSFAGPLLGGYLMHTVQFEWASFITGCGPFIYSFFGTIYLIIKSPCRKESYKEPAIIELQETETEPLVPN